MLYVSHLQIDTKHVEIDIILVNKFQKRVMFTLYCTTQPRHVVITSSSLSKRTVEKICSNVAKHYAL